MNLYRHLVLPLVVLVALVLTACESVAIAPVAPAPEPASAPGGFPITIEHKFGETTIPDFPERVVSLGFNEQDALLALGVTPVAVRYWYGEEPHAVFPWAQDELGDAEPTVLRMSSAELDFEQIIALHPDLISGVYSGMSEEDFNTLSKIAPTIAQSGDYIDYGMPWQEQTRLIGRALGLEEIADQAVSAVEAQFQAVRERHPEWAGKKVVVGAPRGDGQFAFVASEDARSRVFRLLGFEVPSELDDIAEGKFWGQISLEQANLLDRDLLVIHQMQWVEGGRDAVTADPLLSQLDVVKDGRMLFVEGPQDDALQFGTALSLSYFLAEMEERVELAMDDDPATEANPQ